MKRYIGKRALSGLLVVLLSVCFNFTLIRLAPGDPIRIMAGTDNPNEEMIEALQQNMAWTNPFRSSSSCFLAM